LPHVRLLRACCCRYAKAGSSDDEDAFTGVGSGVFPRFLQDTLVNIRSTRGASRGEAEKANNQFARRRRDALRELLRAAASKGVLPWGTTHLADFAEHPKDATETTAIFIDLDEDLEGDSEFNPIDLEQLKSPQPPQPQPPQPLQSMAGGLEDGGGGDGKDARATADWENAASLLNWV
jgi:hypothetical protein